MSNGKGRYVFALCWLLAGGWEVSARAAPGSARDALAVGRRSASGDVEENGLFAGRDRLDAELLARSVLDRNPTLRSARSALEAARARPAQARSLGDLLLAYSLAPQSVGSDAARYGQVLGLAQPLPYPGKRRLRRAIAEAEAEALGHDVAALRLRLATLAALLFYDYYVVDRAIEINDEHIELLESFQRIATVRYAAGEATQQAPLQAEVEVARLLHRRLLLQTERAVLEARLNALLHRPPTASLPPPPRSLAPEATSPSARVSRPAPPHQRLGLTAPQAAEELPAAAVAEAPEEPAAGDELERALAARPDLLAAHSNLEARELEVELARLAARPDFEVRGSYNSLWNEPRHRTTIGAVVTLPIHRGRRRAARSEAEAARAAARTAIEALVDDVQSELTVAHRELQAAEQVVTLYRSRLLPAVADQVSAALSSFRTGRSSFLDLIEAERNQRSVRLDYERSLADVHRRRAELNRTLGRLPVGGTAEDRIRAEPDARGAQP